MRRDRYIFISIIILALGIRIACTELVFPHGYFLKYPALIDELDRGAVDRALDGSYIYLSFHRLTRLVFGSDLRWPLYLQLLIGSMSAGFLGMIGKRLLGRWAGFLAGILAAFSSGLIIHDSIFEPESLLVFFTLSFVFFLICWEEQPRSYLMSALAGLTYGVAVATRPVLLLLIPFLIFRRPEKKRRFLAFIISAFLPMAALLFHNYAMLGTFTLSTMNPGTVLYEGHNPWACGAQSAYPLVLKEQEMQYPGRSDYAHVLYRQIARSVLGPTASIQECNRYWFGRSLSFMKEEPRAEFHLLLNKLHFLTSSYEPHDVEQAAAAEESLARWPVVRFSAVAAFGFLGILLGLTDARRFAVAYLLLACFASTNLIFYVSARQRLHLVPWLIFFTVLALTEMITMGRSRKYLSLTASTTCVILFYAGTSLMPAAAQELIRLRSDGRQAGRFYRAAMQTLRIDERTDDIVKALATAPYAADKLRLTGVNYDSAFYGRVVEILQTRTGKAPTDMSLSFNLGIAQLLAGHPAAARIEFLKVAASGQCVYRYYFGPSSPHYYLGLCSERDGGNDDALLEYGFALEDQPGCPWTMGRRADLLRRLGRDHESRLTVAVMERILDPATKSLSLGMAAYEAGDYIESTLQFRELTRILPDYMKAHIFLAASLERSGDLAAAATEYDQLSRFNSTLAFPEAGYPRRPN